MEVNLLKVVILGLVLGLSCKVIASPTAYLPIGADNHLELQIDYLFSLTRGNPMRKPYAIKEIKGALEQIKETNPGLYQFISHRLGVYHGSKKISRLGVKASISSKKDQFIANQRGLTSSENIQGTIETVWRPNSFTVLQSGMDYRGNGGELVPFNTFLALSKSKFQLDMGYKEHWYSPFKFSSQLISSNVEMGPSVSFSTTEPIERWWRLNFDLFYTRLDKVNKGIRYKGGLHDGRPHLLGTHVNIEPINGWKLGFNRLLQFGGGPRKVTLGDIVKGFVDPASNDNSHSADERDSELGDQLASITTSYRLDRGFAVEIYAELAGEDTQGESNFSLGNQATGFGVYIPRINDNTAFRYEYNRFKTGWYTNHSYMYGNTNNGNVFGHYAADQRKFGHGVPAEIHKASIDFFSAIETSWGLSLASINNKDDSVYSRGYELQLESRHIVQDKTVESKLTYGKSVFAKSYVHFTVATFW